MTSSLISMRDLLGYELDAFQRSAFEVIEAGDDLLGMAPTGSGKTVLALMAVKLRAFDKGKRAILTTPIKALSNQKYAEFNRWFPGRVSLITGDIQALATLPGGDGSPELIIMTSEILSGMLANEGGKNDQELSHLKDVSVVVMDEVHYINDPERGAVWERALSSLDPQVQVVSLSATLRHPERFCEWLSLRTQPVGRKCRVVQRHDRHVPLHVGVYSIRQEFVEIHSTHKNVGFNMADYVDAWKAKKADLERERNVRDLVRILEKEDRLPAIVFAMSRDRCVKMAHTLYERNLLIAPRPVQLDDEWQEYYDYRVELHQEAASDVRRRQDEMYRKYLLPFAKDLHAIPGFEEFKDLLDRGIAYHHAGMLPILREYVELLFQARLLKIVCATESLGVGINMPARTVVFTQLDKPDGSRTGGNTACSMRMLRPDEFWQMAGRAGRRGMDERGYVVYYPFVKPEPAMGVRDLLIGAMPVAISQFKIDAESVLSSTLIQGSLRNHENNRASAKLREAVASLPPPPAPEVVKVILRKDELERKLAGTEDPITGFKLRLNPKQKKEAQAELERIRSSGLVTEELLSREIERAKLEAEADALDRDIETSRRVQIDRLINEGYMEPDESLTVMGKLCAAMGSHGDGMTLERGKAIYEGRLDRASIVEAILWLAEGSADGSLMDAIESWISAEKGAKDIRLVCGHVGFAGLGTFVREVLKLATLMEDARKALLGLERFEAYNRFEGFREILFSGIVSNASLYVTFSPMAPL